MGSAEDQSETQVTTLVGGRTCSGRQRREWDGRVTCTERGFQGTKNATDYPQWYTTFGKGQLDSIL